MECMACRECSSSTWCSISTPLSAFHTPRSSDVSPRLPTFPTSRGLLPQQPHRLSAPHVMPPLPHTPTPLNAIKADPQENHATNSQLHKDHNLIWQLHCCKLAFSFAQGLILSLMAMALYSLYILYT